MALLPRPSRRHPRLRRAVTVILALTLSTAMVAACGDDTATGTGGAEKADGTGQIDGQVPTLTPSDGEATPPDDGPSEGDPSEDSGGGSSTDAGGATDPEPDEPDDGPPTLTEEPTSTPDGSLRADLQAPGCPFLAGTPEIIPDWAAFDADDQAMLSPIVRFASGLQADDYECAWNSMGPGFQGRSAGREQWEAEQVTTDIASYEIISIARQDADTAIVQTVWQSLQDPAYARGGTGETCTTWPLEYRLTRSDGVWSFDRLLSGGADASPC